MTSTLNLVLIGFATIVAYMLLFRGKTVSGEEAHKLVEDGALLVDVRTPEEFAQGHLPNARNIPVHELDRRLSELEPKSKSIVLYCRSGARSRSAASKLRAAGYSSVYDLGGIHRWK